MLGYSTAAQRGAMKQRSTVTTVFTHPAGGRPPIFRSDLDAAVWSVQVGAFRSLPDAQRAYALLRQSRPIATRVHWLTHVGDILTQQRKKAPTAQEAPGRTKNVATSNRNKTRQNA